jgi:preprotein translocase subunit SecG
MMGLIIALHVIICALLIIIILVQAGRGGGLVEGFSGVESMFGTKTNAFLTRTTSVLSILFFLTCLSLALLSARQSKSLMRNIKAQPQTQDQSQTQPEMPSQPQSQPPTQPQPQTPTQAKPQKP